MNSMRCTGNPNEEHKIEILDCLSVMARSEAQA
jgi:hypothetical protein